MSNFSNDIPYSNKLMCNDFNAKLINGEEINAVEKLLLYLHKWISNYMKLMRI